MRSLRHPLIIALRLGLGAVLLYAAAFKWRTPHAFAEDVANYRLLPAALVPTFSAITLGVETVLGLLLCCVFSGALAIEVAVGATALFAVFTFAVASALWRDLKIECGCFGAGSSPATAWTLYRDIGFFLAAAALTGLLLLDRSSRKSR